MVSTRSVENLTLRALSGYPVSLSRSSGRDYQLQARGGFFWTQVQEVPLNAESVNLTPRLREDGTVEVSLAVARKEGDAMQSYSSTVLARPGEWVQLLGPARTEARSTKVYGTQQLGDDALFLLVEY